MGFGVRARSALAAAAVLALFGAGATRAEAQTAGSIRGKVTEASTLRPLSGAQVFVVGSGRGALSNAAGEFVITNVPVGAAQVRVEMIGFAAKQEAVTVEAGKAATVDFALEGSVIALDELVVTGTPQATQKRAIGNAVTSIKAADVVQKAPVSNVTQVLQSRTPGLTVMQGSGTPGTASSFRIRGTGSYQAGTQPVVYVDGIRINSSTQGGFGVGGQSLSALDAINPEDIESIEVIKGPAAATLYGAEAAAGVIQIITKKGKRGEQSLQWSGKFETGQSDWALEMPTNYTLCDEKKIASASWAGCKDQEVGTILTQQPLRDPGALREADSRSYLLNVRGGGDRYSFYASGQRETENGVFHNSYANRTTGRANFVVTPTDKLDLTGSISYSRNDTRLPLNDNASSGWLRNAFRGRPGEMTSSQYVMGWRGLGPEEMKIYDNQTESERFIFGTTINYQPTSWMRHRVVLGLDANERQHTLFYPIDETGRAPYGATAAKGYISQYTPNFRNWTAEYSGSVSKEITSDLTSDLGFGMQLSAYRFHSLQGEGEGLVDNNLRQIDAATVTHAYESLSETRSVGYFLQEQLGWKNRLFVTGGLRVDDHSVFGKNFDLVYYPKAQVAWVVSEEPFFELPGVDQLKLRAAWGRAGNAPGPFQADRTYEAAAVALDNGLFGPAYRSDAYGNPDLHAETGSEVELGFESSLLDSRAGVEFTYYDKTTTEALLSVPVAPSSGYSGSTLQNIGEINNRGVELSLFGTPVSTRPVVWDTRVNLALNSNEFVSFGGSREEPILLGYGGGAQQIAEGYAMGGYWARPIQYENGAPVLNSAGRPVLQDSAVYIGSAIPTREASWTNTITLFRDLTLYTFMDYKGGHYLFNMTEQTRDADGNSYAATHMTPEEFNLRRWGGNMPYIEPADFLKLREVSLTYNLPRSLLQRARLNDVSVSVAGRNLGVLWTKYSGADPEVNIQGADTFIRGDYMSVPMLRQIVTSVNFSF